MNQHSHPYPRESRSLRRVGLLATLGIGFLLAALIFTSARADEGEDDPAPISITDRLAAPPMPANPGQADLGAQVYYQVCMACHGDKGQGLTEEWRAVWEEDANCWQSRCHASNHPPQGFEFPRTCCKAVLGANTLTNFRTAEQLHTYLINTMPWWNPGYLQADEYWQLTAYLLREHGALPQGVTLDVGNAMVYPVHLSAPPPGGKQDEAVLVAFVLVAAAGALVLQKRLHS